MNGVGELVGRLTADELDRSERRRLLLALARAVAGRARSAGARAAVSGRMLADLVADEVAPHLPVRDLLTLRDHHRGLSGDDLAAALIRQASRTTAAVGAAAGALTAAETMVPPALLTAPVQLVAGTVAVVAVELKLVAELHVVYGRAPLGSRSQVAVAYLTSWAGRRGVSSGSGAGPGSPSLSSVLSAAAQHQLRQRLLRRLGRNLSALAPFLAGAVAGAELNRRETKSLGEALMRDLHPRY